MLLQLLSLFLPFIVFMVNVHADVDCSKRPPDIRNCCEVPNLIIDNIKEECMSQLKDSVELDSPPPPPHHPHGAGGKPREMKPCFAECLLNKTNILKNGEINTELESALSEIYQQDPEFVSLVKNIIEECSHGPEGAPPLPKFQSENGKCSPFAAIIIGCIQHETLNKCPESMQVQNEECNNAREYKNKCAMGPPPRPPPHKP